MDVNVNEAVCVFVVVASAIDVFWILPSSNLIIMIVSVFTEEERDS